MSDKLNLSSPWVIFYKEMEAMFAEDSEINMSYNDDEKEIRMYVEDNDKAFALMQLLPTEKEFGNVTVKIKIIPANNNANAQLALVEKAFKNNPAFAYTYESSGPMTFNANYVVFKKKVVQYHNDALSDLHGVRSDLYENMARDIFGTMDNIYYCTDIED